MFGENSHNNYLTRSGDKAACNNDFGNYLVQHITVIQTGVTKIDSNSYTDTFLNAPITPFV